MNEIIAALEAMIRRIVAQELANVPAPAPVLGTDYDDASFKAAFLKLLLADSPELNTYIRDTIIEDSYVHDHIMELAGDVRDDDLRSRVQNIVSDMDFCVSVS